MADISVFVFNGPDKQAADEEEAKQTGANPNASVRKRLVNSHTTHDHDVDSVYFENRLAAEVWIVTVIQ